jgi:hypothetical protein
VLLLGQDGFLGAERRRLEQFDQGRLVEVAGPSEWVGLVMLVGDVRVGPEIEELFRER